MALKGSATIELTNADGTIEVVKHDNMITNAPKDLLKSYRGEMPPLFNIVSNNESYAKAVFGGVLLFDEILNDDPDDYFIPSTKITGYASQNGYAGTDTYRGSYNGTESGVQADGSYKFVWDFSTSQANGTIQSLALCPNLMGRIGATAKLDTSVSLSNSIFTPTHTPFDNNGYMRNSYVAGINHYYIEIVAIHNGIAYAVDEQNVACGGSSSIKSNGGVLKLYKFKVGMSEISIIENVCMATYIGVDDVTLPSTFISGLSTSTANADAVAFNYIKSTNKLIAFPCYTSGVGAAGAKVKYIEVDLANNYAITSYEFTNNAGYNISAESPGTFGTSPRSYGIYINNDYIVTNCYNGSVRKLYVTKRSDNTDIKEVKFSDTQGFSFANNYYFTPFYSSNRILIFRTHHFSSDTARWYILDMQTGIVRVTNFNNTNNMKTYEFDNNVCYISGGPYLTLKTVINPFVITTKNNLDTPVTKTASQTMKITYTLSEVADSGV